MDNRGPGAFEHPIHLRYAPTLPKRGPELAAKKRRRSGKMPTKLDDLMEQLAHAEHASWARWMDYLFSKCEYDDQGRACIPAVLVARWKRQAATTYAALSEQEKESDRDEVRHILPLIESAYGERRG